MGSILGTRIKTLREERNLSQKDFAKIMNISNTTLSQYENGQRTPSDEIKQKIADFFDVSIDYLLGRTDMRILHNPKNENTVPVSLNISGLPAEAVKLVEDYIELLRYKYNPEKTRKKQ